MIWQVDWVGRNLYRCDKDTIEVTNLDGKFSSRRQGPVQRCQGRLQL